MNVSVDDFSDSIMQALSEWSMEVTEKMKAAVDTTSDEVNQTIKDHIAFKIRSGDYVKAFRVKRGAYEDLYNKRNTWYVAAPYYRLTHLLEYGHATSNGGRTKAYPHIRYGEELAQKQLPALIEEAVKRG